MPAVTSCAVNGEAPGMPCVTWSYSAAVQPPALGTKGGGPLPLTQAPLSSRPLFLGSEVAVCVTRDASRGLAVACAHGPSGVTRAGRGADGHNSLEGGAEVRVVHVGWTVLDPFEGLGKAHPREPASEART